VAVALPSQLESVTEKQIGNQYDSECDSRSNIKYSLLIELPVPGHGLDSLREVGWAVQVLILLGAALVSYRQSMT
jgi:hypothetical protein